MSQSINIYEWTARLGVMPSVAHMAAVMTAAAEGKPILWRQVVNPSNHGKIVSLEGCTWDWHHIDFRVDPASKPSVPRPFKTDDYVVPIVECIGNHASLITGAIYRVSSAEGCINLKDQPIGNWPLNRFRHATEAEIAGVKGLALPLCLSCVRHATEAEISAHMAALDPVAKGHNPSNLKVSQVDEGWRLLDIDEIEARKALGKTVNAARMIDLLSTTHIQIMHEIWLRGEVYGHCVSNAYRTRLSRAELAALIAPPAPKVKVRRALTSADLPPIFWLRTAHGDSLVTYVRESGISIASPTAPWHTWHDLMDEGYLYSSDRCTWLPFYIES